MKNETENRKPAAKKSGSPHYQAPHKLLTLITVVNRSKCDFYLDLIAQFEVNVSFSLSANGTVSTEKLSSLGLSTDTEKSIIISIIRQDKVKDALSTLENKFRTVRGGKGIAFTVPFSGTIGVAIYRFLSNKLK